MKTLSLILIFILSFFLSSAQENRPTDVVRFKDGSELRGNITAYSEGEYLEVEIGAEKLTIEGSQYQEIERVIFDKLTYYDNTGRFWYDLQMGFTLGQSNNFSGTESHGLILVSSGYQFHKLLGIGIGTGYRNYSNVQTMPVFVAIQGDLLKTRATPFYYIHSGYGIGFRKNEEDQFGTNVKAKGGLLYTSGLGVRLNTRKTFLTLSMGWLMQKSKITRTTQSEFFTSILGGESVFVENRTYRRMEVKVGIGF